MEHLALITSMPDIFIHINIEDFCKQLIKRAFFTSASAVSIAEINCQSYALHCLNNLSCSDSVLFEEILLSQTNSESEMLEKFEILITRGNAQITNQMIQLIMRFMSSLQGKKMISQEYGLIDKLVQTCYKIQTKKSIEQSDGMTVNKDALIILLHSLFDYDE